MCQEVHTSPSDLEKESVSLPTQVHSVTCKKALDPLSVSMG